MQSTVPQPKPVVPPDKRIAVVLPCFKVKRHILDVISRIGDECWRIYVVDDHCPEFSGDYVEANCTDPRVHVIRHATNQGVGGAVITGYLKAIESGASILVKIDGDGQMPPELLPSFVGPILNGEADYAKGNRFFDLTNVGRMPALRLCGNAALSFVTKLSAGYWNSFDPANGYTAIHAEVAKRLPLDKISRSYFFETDMLFRLGSLRAVVVDVPMDAQYGDEISSLRVSRIFGEFLFKHVRNFGKRIFYNYFLRDFSAATVELVMGALLVGFGLIFGVLHWIDSLSTGQAASAGTVMLAALPLLVGIQLVISFLNYDIQSVPRRPIHPALVHKNVGNNPS